MSVKSNYNAISSASQVCVSGLCLFVLYAFILRKLGAQFVGAWSLVLASSSTAQIASFGLSNSIVRFVAEDFARGDQKAGAAVINNSVSFVILVFTGILLLLWPVIKMVLFLVVPLQMQVVASGMLPYALCALWCGVISGIYQSGLDGTGRVYVRNYIIIASSIISLIVTSLAVLYFGGLALAPAHLVQCISLYSGSMFGWNV